MIRSFCSNLFPSTGITFCRITPVIRPGPYIGYKARALYPNTFSCFLAANNSWVRVSNVLLSRKISQPNLCDSDCQVTSGIGPPIIAWWALENLLRGRPYIRHFFRFLKTRVGLISDIYGITKLRRQWLIYCLKRHPRAQYMLDFLHNISKNLAPIM